MQDAERDLFEVPAGPAPKRARIGASADQKDEKREIPVEEVPEWADEPVPNGDDDNEPDNRANEREFKDDPLGRDRKIIKDAIANISFREMVKASLRITAVDDYKAIGRTTRGPYVVLTNEGKSCALCGYRHRYVKVISSRTNRS